MKIDAKRRLRELGRGGAVAAALAACLWATPLAEAAAPGPTAEALRAAAAPIPVNYRARGEASWYGAWHQGRKTASGDAFDKNELTAAHRFLQFGSRLRVTNLQNGRCVEVVVSDRGPYIEGRIIDLSEAAARRLGMLEEGVAPVRIEEARRGAGAGCG